MDEEHEPAYKQDEHPPYYHARDAALALARRSGAVVVMGSATPDVSTHYEATRGRHHLLRLPERVPRADGRATPLPAISVVDMRRELREGNRSVFSRSLTDALDTTVASADSRRSCFSIAGAARLSCSAGTADASSIAAGAPCPTPFTARRGG